MIREKEIKGWRGSKKIKLIESMNPGGNDLARDWEGVYKPEASLGNEIPRPAGDDAGFGMTLSNAIGGPALGLTASQLKQPTA